MSRHSGLQIVGGLSIAFACLAASCSSDDDSSETSETDGPVAVRIDFEFEVNPPPTPSVGAFVVTDGADALGCDAGTATISEGPTPETVENLMECDDGTITVHFDAVPDPDDENRVTGPWNVFEGTGAFEELSAGGEMVSDFDRVASSSTMTLTGEVRNG
jgi:hypothetical protein